MLVLHNNHGEDKVVQMMVGGMVGDVVGGMVVEMVFDMESEEWDAVEVQQPLRCGMV